jgi:hypothetical protein
MEVSQGGITQSTYIALRSVLLAYVRVRFRGCKLMQQLQVSHAIPLSTTVWAPTWSAQACFHNYESLPRVGFPM